MMLKKLALQFAGRRGAIDYDQFYENDPSQDLIFSQENTKIFLMKETGDNKSLFGASYGKPHMAHDNLARLMFTSSPQKYNGVASKIHIIESTGQILLCYIFHDERQSRKKDRSPNSGYGSLRSGSGSMLDYQDRSMEDELQSSVSSVNSIASSIASLASSIGIGSFNGKNCSSTTPDPPLCSSIPTDCYLKERGPSLKRVTSSPSRLAMEGFEKSRKKHFGLGVLLGLHCGQYDLKQLKTFVFDRIHSMETQAMISKLQLFDLLSDGDKKIADIMAIISDRFLHYLNVVSSGKRIRNMWQTVHLGGLVGSRRAKNNIVDIICDLYEQYEGERNFMSSVVTAILSANSTWHTNMCNPRRNNVHSIQGRKIVDLYGGPSSNFPVRITFVSRDETLLQGFLALTSYFQRNTIFVRNDKNRKITFLSRDSTQLSFSDMVCCYMGDTIVTAVKSSLRSNTFSLISEGQATEGIPQVASSETLCSAMTNSSSSVGASDDKHIRFSTAFVDYTLSRKLYEEGLIVPNPGNLPIISHVYHPSCPVMGISSDDKIVKDFKSGFLGFHNALQLSMNGAEIIPKMIINDANSYDCQVCLHDGTSPSNCRIKSSTVVRRILKNFVNLKQLTGNNKLCLIYLESELQTLSYIREAYLTFCATEPSPPKKFLDAFNMDHSDGEMFNLIQ